MTARRDAIDPGQLHKRVRFEERSGSPDGLGGLSDGWQLYKEGWAGFQPRRGRTESLGHAPRSLEPVRLLVRYDAQLHVRMRCIIDGATYRIVWIAPYDGHPDYMECEIHRGGLI